ncbi:MAG: NHL repeat-containing protein [Planctomycetaceae bacterium]
MNKFLCFGVLSAILWNPGLVLQAAGPEYPLGITADSDGTVFLADRNLPGVWKIQGGKASLFFQASRKFRTPLNAVRCLAIDAKGRLHAGDSSTREVYRFNEQGQPEALTKGGVGIATGIAFDQAGNLVVADLEFPGRIVRIPESGGEPVEIAQINAPRGLAVDKEGAIWVVTHGKDRQVVKVLADGQLKTLVSGRPFEFPQSIALDSEGNGYIADGYSKAIWKVSSDGKPSKLVEGNGLVHPDCVARRGDGLVVVDPRALKDIPGSSGVYELSLEGKLTPLNYEAP